MISSLSPRIAHNNYYVSGGSLGQDRPGAITFNWEHIKGHLVTIISLIGWSIHDDDDDDDGPCRFLFISVAFQGSICHLLSFANAFKRTQLRRKLRPSAKKEVSTWPATIMIITI